MPYGPIVLFDKSALQMLNLDEAVLFDCVFPTNICPIFFVEVLADLYKKETKGRVPEDIVADLANKTPVIGSYPNAAHSSLCLIELVGSKFEMRNVPALGGGQPVRHKGKVGIYYSESPEARAFSRWQAGRFEEVEREFASGWRQQLASMNLVDAAKLVKAVFSVSGSPRTLDDALALARDAVRGIGQRFQTLEVAYKLLGLPVTYWRTFHQNWRGSGHPLVLDYATYTAHCLLVDVFFYIAIAKGLISPDRPSNKVDMAYLYYLPFCQIFASNDRLHKNTAPLLMNAGQCFLGGNELKKGMQELCAHVGSLPADLLSQGMFKIREDFASDERFLPAQLGLKLFGPHPRDEDIPPPNNGSSLHSEIMDMVKGFEASAKRRDGDDIPVRLLQNPDQLTIQRRIPLKKGRWQILPPGIKADDD